MYKNFINACRCHLHLFVGVIVKPSQQIMTYCYRYVYLVMFQTSEFLSQLNEIVVKNGCSLCLGVTIFVNCHNKDCTLFCPTGATVTHLQLMNFVNITKCLTFYQRLQNQAKQTGCLWAVLDMVLIYM